MPGIPRKPYCQPCKRRRVKCDEKWPTCSACKRAGIECPGPSSRIKFVLNNSHKVRGENAADGFASSSESSDGGVPPSTSSGGLILAERPSARARNASEFRSYRLMNVWDRHVSMNSCDRVTARLVTLMDASPQQASSIFRPLQALPSRLSLSECLKDSVAYWCSSWVDYHHGLQAPSWVSWNHYGKLLRSLQRAMQSTQSVTIETTAAATILVKTSEIFNLEVYKKRDILHQQVRAVTAFIKLRGIPNMNDPLDVLMAYEQQQFVQMVAILSPAEAEFYYTPLWKEARARVIEQVALNENRAEIHVLADKMTIYFPEYVHDMGLCFNDPSSFSEKAKTIQLEMRKYISDIEFLFPDHWDNAEASHGAIIESTDPDFFVGRKYTLQSHQTFEFLEIALFAPIVPCFMVTRLRELYNEPPDIAFENKYREFCTRFWMFIPHLKTQDPLSLGDTFFHYGFTFGAATEQEKGHLADFLMQMDAINEFGKDKNALIKTTDSVINQLIGVPADWTTKKSEPGAEVLETRI